MDQYGILGRKWSGGCSTGPKLGGVAQYYLAVWTNQ